MTKEDLSNSSHKACQDGTYVGHGSTTLWYLCGSWPHYLMVPLLVIAPLPDGTSVDHGYLMLPLLVMAPLPDDTSVGHGSTT